MGKREKSSSEAFVTGLVLSIGFGIAWAATDKWYFVFPLIFAGILPAARGLQAMLARQRERRVPKVKGDAGDEKEILRVAKAEGGRVTPALIALQTSLSTERAEEILHKMVKRNFALMQITSEGRLEYEFPEFEGRNRPAPGVDKSTGDTSLP